MRYAIRIQPTNSLWDPEPLLPHLTVDGPKEVDTRLVDCHGNRIVRLQGPIGFGRDDEA